jgi:hypothetical protein
VGPDVAVLRRSREYRLLFTGQTVSFAGSMITYVAMPYQAYRLSGSSLVVGLLSVTELVPMVAAALLGGVLADALDRRKLIMVTEAGLLPGSVLLAVNAAAWHQLWLLFVLAAVSAGLYGVQRPSQDALVPALLERDDLTAAAALTGVLGNVAMLAGPLAGGGIIALAGLPAAYAADGASGLAGLAAVTLMRPVPRAAPEGQPGLRGLADGLRYAWSRPELMGSYLIDMAAMFFGAPYALFPALAARLGGPAVLGLLYAAPAAGGVLVSLTSGWTARVSRQGRAIVLAAAAWGAAIALLGWAPGRWWAVAALAAAGGADMVSALFRMMLWNQTIPAGLRGRLAGLEMISYTTGEPLGSLEAGLAAALTGSARVSIASGGIACVAAAALIAVALPGLWRYDARNQSARAPGPASTDQPAVEPRPEPSTVPSGP